MNARRVLVFVVALALAATACGNFFSSSSGSSGGNGTSGTGTNDVNGGSSGTNGSSGGTGTVKLSLKAK